MKVVSTRYLLAPVGDDVIEREFHSIEHALDYASDLFAPHFDPFVIIKRVFESGYAGAEKFTDTRLPFFVMFKSGTP